MHQCTRRNTQGKRPRVSRVSLLFGIPQLSSATYTPVSCDHAPQVHTAASRQMAAQAAALRQQAAAYGKCGQGLGRERCRGADEA